MSKRKHQGKRDYCTSCEARGESGAGHLAEFCAFLGGQYEGKFKEAAAASKRKKSKGSGGASSETGGASQQQAAIFHTETNAYLNTHAKHITNHTDVLKDMETCKLGREQRLKDLESTVKILMANAKKQDAIITDQKSTIDQMDRDMKILKTDYTKRKEATRRAQSRHQQHLQQPPGKYAQQQQKKRKYDEHDEHDDYDDYDEHDEYDEHDGYDRRVGR
jgi:hypothetical protein